MTITEQIASLEARLRDNERVTAGQGTVIDILREDALRHADAETVSRLQAVQLVHGEDIAVLKSRTEASGVSWAWLNPATWWERASEESSDRAIRVFRQLALIALAGFAAWWAATTVDRVLDILVERASRPTEVEVRVDPPAPPPAAAPDSARPPTYPAYP